MINHSTRPPETVLVLAALYAGGHRDLNISGVIACAATGAILGDNIGYWLSREFGYRLLLRYGRYVGLSDARIKLGQYLFLRHAAGGILWSCIFGLGAHTFGKALLQLTGSLATGLLTGCGAGDHGERRRPVSSSPLDQWFGSVVRCTRWLLLRLVRLGTISGGAGRVLILNPNIVCSK